MMTGTIKLGDAATFVNGYPFKPETWTEEGLPIIRIQNLNNPNAAFNRFSGSIPEKYLVRKGDILISWSASLGAYEWAGEDAYLNQHIFKVVFNKSPIDKHFLRYAVQSKLSEMEKEAHGATMRHIVKKDFDGTLIPYPSLQEQERIVAELDSLSGILDKQEEQLKELDTLAQSVFYDMFGNPMENEKGWVMQDLGRVIRVKGRVGWKGYKKEDLRDYGPLAIGGSHLADDGSLDLSAPVYLSREKYEESPEIMVETGDLILVQRGTIGKIGLVNKDIGEATINPCVLILRPITIDSIYALHFFLNKDTQRYLQTLIRGVAQPMITQQQVNAIRMPIPPISLQKSFAERIESIERQKNSINQAISETQNLFDYTMDKYFG